MTPNRKPPSPPPAIEEPNHLRPADLQAFVDDLYSRKKPSGVVDALIRERRGKVPPYPDRHRQA